MLEKVGSNPNPKAVEKYEEMILQKHTRKLWGAVRFGLCAFCGWFAFTHIEALVKNGLLALEMVGVILCLGFIAQTIAEIMEGK